MLHGVQICQACPLNSLILACDVLLLLPRRGKPTARSHSAVCVCVCGRCGCVCE